MQYISRKGNFDSGHRVLNESMKCFNMHGHTYLYELTFSFNSFEEIGYAIDFKEIKRVGCQWIDDILDHAMILNPKDKVVIKAAQETGSKLWLMSLNGKKMYCNPTVENIAKEVFLAMKILFTEAYKNVGLKIHEVRIWETPNCCTTCKSESINKKEKNNFYQARLEEITNYARKKGKIVYDDRKK